MLNLLVIPVTVPIINGSLYGAVLVCLALQVDILSFKKLFFGIGSVSEPFLFSDVSAGWRRRKVLNLQPYHHRHHHCLFTVYIFLTGHIIVNLSFLLLSIIRFYVFSGRHSNTND